MSAPFRGHHDGGIRIARGDGRHDGRIYDAQGFDAAHAQALVDDSQRILAHLAGTDRVEDRRADVAGGAREIFVGLDLGAGLVFLGREAGHRPGAADAAG